MNARACFPASHVAYPSHEPASRSPRRCRLDRDRIDIGVVGGIVGINWRDVTIEGFANHAGTTPMTERRDALLAAATFVEAVNRVVTSAPGRARRDGRSARWANPGAARRA